MKGESSASEVIGDLLMTIRFFVLALFGTLSSACAGPAFVARPAPLLAPAITERGDLVYRGRIYSLEGTPAEPTYVYERRVEAHGDRVVSTHVTRDRDGVIQLAESTEHTPDY